MYKRQVLGVCGGYQMLGQTINDPEGIEGTPGAVEGLGLLDVETVMSPEKRLAQVIGRDLASGATVSGYEIHIGQTNGPDCARPWLEVGDRSEGATSVDGRIQGCYLHGIFAADKFRAAFIDRLGGRTEVEDYVGSVETTLEQLADHLEQHADIDAILSCAAEV